MLRPRYYLPLSFVGLAVLLALARWAWTAGTVMSVAGDHSTAGVGNTQAPLPSCGLAWRVVPSPNVGASSNVLFGVAALAANDVWAVGTTSTIANGGLILHWDGSQWNVVPVPDPGTYVRLTGISALAANDIWAVGNYTNGGPRLLTLHWDGSSWTQVPCPSPGYNYSNTLYSVAARAPNDVWTAGFYRHNSPQGLFMHWDGSVWSVVPSPYDPSINWFQDLTTLTPDNVWAAGFLTGQSPSLSTIFHWDGSAWAAVSSPDVSSLTGISARAANDIWAVGLNGILHWDGASWSLANTTAHNLNGVKALAADNAWAVGTDSIVHWDGISWSTVPTPTVGSLSRIAGVAAGDLWAVGSTNNGGVTQTLIEHYSDPCVVITPTPSPTPPCPPPNWTLRAPYPRDISGEAVIHQNGRIYSFGGVSDGAVITDAYKYDPFANTWTAIAPLPQGRQLASAVEDGRYIYILGGNDAYVGGHVTNTVYRYDQSTNTYQVMTPFSISTSGQGAASTFGKIYRIAGCTTPDCSSATASMEVYDIATDTWTSGPPYPLAKGLLMATGLDGDILAAGGVPGETTKAYRYDRVTSTWDDAAVADLPATRWAAASGVPRGSWVIAGGYVNGGGSSATAITYDPGTNAWYPLPGMFMADSYSGAGQTGTDLYVVGGLAPGGGGQGTDDNQDFSGAFCPTPGPTRTSTPATTATATPTGQAASATPTPIATRTATPIVSATPSAAVSATPFATGTVVATVTVCPLLFSDVAPSDPFYPYIRCLACRAILSGYSTSPPCALGGTPCFNGGASVTRGQVAKIVANAAGFSDAIPSKQQTFADVPSSSPFWIYVERTALHGVISGYSTSPPCPGGVPCFLPGNPLTRGQLAKIDANAAGFAEPIPSTQQTFADVSYGSPFWVYVERAVLHNVISGYSTSPPCGGAVPCFLPGNPVTRNQTAKIVATTFYPTCQTPQR